MASDQGSDEFERETGQPADVDPVDGDQVPTRISASTSELESTRARSRLVRAEIKSSGEEGPPGPPAGTLDFLYRLWLSLNWRNTSQVVVIVLALGIAAALVFGSLGLVAYFVIGTSPWLTLSLSIVAGGGASGGTSIYLKRHRARRAGRTDQRATGDDSGPQNGRPPG